VGGGRLREVGGDIWGAAFEERELVFSFSRGKVAKSLLLFGNSQGL